MRLRPLLPFAIAAAVGAAGGALAARAAPGALAGPAPGALAGLLFAALARGRATSPGAGLTWGLGFAFVLWLAVPVGLGSVLGGGALVLGALVGHEALGLRSAARVGSG